MVKRNYPGPSPMCGQSIRTAWLRLREEKDRCRPFGPEYESVQTLMTAMANGYREITGREIAEPGPAHRAGGGV